ncbi:MAG TPA: hypothetical protein VK570_13715 [Rubrivivax sp.]|nr:hypothetical protein [Rubrivivax sp.]
MHAPTDARPEPLATSPWLPRRLLKLLTAPRDFFADTASLGHRPSLPLAAYAVGLASAVDRLGVRTIEGSPTSLDNWIADAWLHYWTMALLSGLISAVLIWYIGGWWYKVRLRWSGAADPDPALARRVYTWQGLVVALPVLAHMLLQTLLYADFRAAMQAAGALPVVLLGFAFWSCWTSYAAVTTVFPVDKGKATLWFLVLPALLLLLLSGTLLVSYLKKTWPSSGPTEEAVVFVQPQCAPSRKV